MINNHSKLPYRKGVGLIIINECNKIFIGKRIDNKNYYHAWQFPQGGIMLGETPSSAVMREMKEEIGSDKADIIAESEYWYRYNIPLYLIKKLWNNQYRGQEQKWFLLRFKGKDSDIDLNHSSYPEFSEWKWVRKKDLHNLVIPLKKRIYSFVFNEFHSIMHKKI